MTRLPLCRRLSADQRGVALIEFALCLPFLVLLFIGGYQFSDAISAYRKVTRATRTIADLTAQYITVTDNDLDTILNASTQVMAPYSVSSAKLIVSQIKIDAAGVSTVDWSKGKNVDGLKPNTPFAIPVAIRQPNTSLIIAAIDYTYTPGIASTIIGTIPLHEQIIMSPRATASIEKK